MRGRRSRRSRRSSTEFDTDGPPETCSAMVTQSGLSAPDAHGSTVATRRRVGSAHHTRSCPVPKSAAQGLVADELLTRHRPFQFALSHPQALAITSVQEFRLWEGSNPGARAN